MTSPTDPLEQLVRSAARRATKTGLVVLARDEISLAELPAGTAFFSCVDARLLLYRMTPGAYAFVDSRNRLVPTRPRSEDEPASGDDSADEGSPRAP